MQPCTYFIIAFILLLAALGAASSFASAASFIVSAAMFAGGIFTKLAAR